MSNLRPICENVLAKHTTEIQQLGYNSAAIQKIVQRDYPTLDMESSQRCADVIQLMLMNSSEAPSS